MQSLARYHISGKSAFAHLLYSSRLSRIDFIFKPSLIGDGNREYSSELQLFAEREHKLL